MKTTFLMLGSATALRQHSTEMSLAQESDKVSNYNALKNVADKLGAIRQEVVAEGETEDALYKKNTCWCNQNNDAKTAAIETATNEITSLSAAIESADGTIAEKTEAIASNSESLDAEMANMDAARTERLKEKNKFLAESSEATTNIADLAEAIKTMDAFFADDASAAEQDIEDQRALLPASLLSSASKSKIVKLSRAHFDSEQSDQIAAFVQAVDGSRVGPQSGQIVGMIKQMHEQMSADLKDAEDAEAAAVLAFEELNSSKGQTIDELSTAIEQDTNALTDAREAKSTGALDLEASQKQLEKSQAFLQTLEETCGDLDDVYAANQKARNTEIAALSDVLEMLTADETRGLFAKNTESFIQVVSRSQDKRVRDEANKVLRAAFRKSGDVALLALASSVGLNAFSKVKEAVAKLGEAIQQQMKDEVVARDTCVSTLHDLDMAAKNGQAELNRYAALIADKTEVQTSLIADISFLQQDLYEEQLSLQQSGENYIQASKGYQHFIGEQKAMIGVLEVAKERLAKFYSPEVTESLAQVSEAQTPPEAMAKYEKNASSTGVMGYIQELVDDFKHEIAAREGDAQRSIDEYSKTSAESQASIATFTTQIDNKIQEKATVDGEIMDNKQLQKAELEKLEESGIALTQQHQTCDFLIKNFDARQESMSTEVQAMKEVIAILSGAQ